MKRSIALLLLLLLLSIPTFCQTDKRVDFFIDNALKTFFSYVGDMTRPVNASDPELFAKDYQGNYFFYNGSQSTVLDFLRSYKRGVGTEYYINKFKITSLTRKDNETNLFVIDGTLERNPTKQEHYVNNQEDYLIKAEKVKIEVYWEEDDSVNVRIMRINMPPDVEKVFPVYSSRYAFDIREATSQVNGNGEKCHLVVDSWKWQEKEYPGISKEPERYDSVRVAFNAISNEPFLNRGTAMSISSINELEEEVKANDSKEPREIHLDLTQEESGNTISWIIKQDGKKYFNPFHFDLTSSRSLMNVKAHYAPNIGGGISLMTTPHNMRWSFGFLIMTNGNNYRDLFHKNDLSTSSSTSQVQSTHIDPDGKVIIISGESVKWINGYEVIENTYHPENDNYEEVENYANNDLDRYTAKCLLMTNVGCFINNWSRFDLGIGAVRKRDISHYNKAYEIKKYSYSRETIYEPIEMKEDIWKKKDVEWRFAVRPALDLYMPVGDTLYICAGIGYTFVFNSSNLSSLDYNLGIAFNL